VQVEPVRIRRLELEEFRLYHALELEPPPAGIRIVGPNGSGKTTIIEALLLLSTTRSRRGVLDVDLVNYTSGAELGTLPYARVRGLIDRGSRSARIEIFLERTGKGNTARKLLRVSDSPRRAVDVIGLFPTVGFSPEDLELVIGSPSIRRRFVDVVLSQVDREYMRHLSRYNRILAHRNGLLRAIAEGASRRDELTFWDEQIVALGAYVFAARAAAIARIDAHAARHFSDLASFEGTLRVAYSPPLAQSSQWWSGIAESGLEVRSAAQRIAVVFERALNSSHSEDVARRATTVGPHRDELEIKLDGRPIQRFGSRGQQRLAIVALKLAEIDFMADRLSVRPVLLLDDVLSELDEAHRRELLARVRESDCQLFVTTTDEQDIRHPHLDDLDLARIATPGELVVEASIRG
jgi:DNA replication and repair protein RecF